MRLTWYLIPDLKYPRSMLDSLFCISLYCTGPPPKKSSSCVAKMAAAPLSSWEHSSPEGQRPFLVFSLSNYITSIWMNIFNSNGWHWSPTESAILFSCYFYFNILQMVAAAAELKGLPECWHWEVAWNTWSYRDWCLTLMACRGIPEMSHGAVSIRSLFLLCNWRFTKE